MEAANHGYFPNNAASFPNLGRWIMGKNCSRFALSTFLCPVQKKLRAGKGMYILQVKFAKVVKRMIPLFLIVLVGSPSGLAAEVNGGPT